MNAQKVFPLISGW